MFYFAPHPKTFIICISLCSFSVFAENTENVNNVISENVNITNNEFTTTLSTPTLEPKKHNSWLDKHKSSLTKFIDATAYKLDDFFGTPNPSKPAEASLRIMLDMYDDKHNGLVFKPRLRGKIRLPTLEHHLQAVIGDDDLDNEQGGGAHTTTRPSKTDDLIDRQSHKDNSSLALRFSRLKQDLNIQTDLDLGLRGSDVYLKLYGQKQWDLPHHFHSKIEQVYKYGIKSEHYALSTMEFSQPQSKTRTLYSRSHLIYTHKNHEEDLNWSHSLYQQHQWHAKHGVKEFSYGVYLGGDVNNHSKANLNNYGPYVSYRQPIWRDWLFVQSQISFYNNEDLNQEHHLAAFGRIEILF